MAVLATQRFSGSELVKQSGNWIARETWVVVGTPDKQVAIESAIAFNTPHGLNPNMRAGRRYADNYKGPLSWIVTAEFTFGDHGLCEPNPLDEPPEIEIQYGQLGGPADTDLDNNPILNSAGDPIHGGVFDVVRTVILCVRKNLPFFNVQMGIQYTNAVNSDPFVINGAGGVDPGQAICHFIKPARPYTASSPYIPVDYQFEFAPLANPWDFHPTDQGRNGWYSQSGTPTKGMFCYKSGDPVSEDVLLDGMGQPIDPAIRVRDAAGGAQAPVPNPNLPSFVTKEPTYSTATQTTLFYKAKLRLPFAGLL
jgi:hypothetical protein